MKTNTELIKFAEKALKEKWRYCWGAFGQMATTQSVDRLIAQYPGYNSKHKTFLSEGIGKTRLCDCYGLIKSFLWWRGDGADPAYNAKEDRNTDKAYKDAKEKSVISTLPDIPGLILYSPGHVGIYTGRGRYIEMRTGGEVCREGNVSDKKFNHWFKDINIDYKNPAAPVSGGYSVRVTAQQLNIRREPSVYAVITGVIRDMGVYTVTEEAEDDRGVKWGRLEDERGWISLGFAERVI